MFIYWFVTLFVCLSICYLLARVVYFYVLRHFSSSDYEKIRKRRAEKKDRRRTTMIRVTETTNTELTRTSSPQITKNSWKWRSRKKKRKKTWRMRTEIRVIYRTGRWSCGIRNAESCSGTPELRRGSSTIASRVCSSWLALKRRSFNSQTVGENVCRLSSFACLQTNAERTLKSRWETTRLRLVFPGRWQRDSSVLPTSRVLRWGYITRNRVIYFLISDQKMYPPPDWSDGWRAVLIFHSPALFRYFFLLWHFPPVARRSSNLKFPTLSRNRYACTWHFQGINFGCFTCWSVFAGTQRTPSCPSLLGNLTVKSKRAVRVHTLFMDSQFHGMLQQINSERDSPLANRHADTTHHGLDAWFQAFPPQIFFVRQAHWT